MSEFGSHLTLVRFLSFSCPQALTSPPLHRCRVPSISTQTQQSLHRSPLSQARALSREFSRRTVYCHRCRGNRAKFEVDTTQERPHRAEGRLETAKEESLCAARMREKHRRSAGWSMYVSKLARPVATLTKEKFQELDGLALQMTRIRWWYTPRPSVVAILDARFPPLAPLVLQPTLLAVEASACTYYNLYFYLFIVLVELISTKYWLTVILIICFSATFI